MKSKSTKIKTASLLMALLMVLSLLPIGTASAAGPIAVYGGGGGGGGNGGMPANGGTLSYVVASGGTSGGGLDGYAGGSTGWPAGDASTGTGGGGGGSGGGYPTASTNGADGKGSSGGPADGGAGGGNGAAAGAGNGFSVVGTGENGGSGGAGGPGNAANETLADSAPDSIMVQAGSGGNGGNTTGGPNPSAAGGDGGAGGSGGAANLTLTAPTVTVSGSVVVESGSDGLDGQVIGGWIGNNIGITGSGGTGGAASLQCTGALSAPSITVTKHDGTVDVDIGTVDATANTTITASGTAASDFVIGIINVASGTTLTIDNSNGELTIGAINIASGGNVIISTPIPGIIVPPTFSGETSMTLTQGYAATSTGAYTITGNPAPTVTKTSGNAAITWDDTAKKLNIAAGLIVGTYPVELTASNGVQPDANLTFTLNITAAPVGVAPAITSGNSLNLYFSVGGTFQVTATGTPVPTFSLSGAPNGVTIDSVTGRITIAPTTSIGTHTFTITASNGMDPPATQTFTLTIMMPMASPVIMSPGSINIVYGEGGTFQVSASGNPAPTYSLSGAPSGVTIDPNTGLMTIAATVKPGTYTFTIIASNGIDPDARQTFTLTVGKVSDVPKTGDNFPLEWLTLAFIVLVGSAALLLKTPESKKK